MSQGVQSIPVLPGEEVNITKVRRNTDLRTRLRRLNWPLVAGGLIILLIVLMAAKGQDWALQDPMQENYALRVDGKIVTPPYPPFEIPGYPLGTDQFGRDLLSRMMWGVRPTLYLVSIVAITRLILGLFLGMFIGWSAGRRGKLLDTILSVALAVPVLIVALMGISAVGIEKGLSAFIFGLALTGWAETARIVSSQTRIIRGQAYIEAAQALGASDARIFRKHVIHHISPLFWMLFAFEISATLLVVSELGFLGYYIGGGVWIEVLDFVSVNATGLPELGQMLSTALVSLTKPVTLIVVGSFVFLMILGFNLLGEGLRLHLSRQTAPGRGRYYLFGERIGDWFEGRISPALSDWVEANGARLGYAGALVLILGGWFLWSETRPQVKPKQEQAYLSVPGDHHWATERHDAQGTRWVRATGPAEAEVAWMFLEEYEYVGGPAVDASGNVYIANDGNQLIAISPEGQEIWRAVTMAEPVGAPALGANGEIYVSDLQGGLSAFSADGEALWRFAPEGGREGTSGPVVDSKGNIYYTRVDSVQAVAPDGKPLWLGYAFDGYAEEPPILSTGEGYVFLMSGALSAKSGALLDLGELTSQDMKITTPVFFIGADGKTYFRKAHEVLGWVATKEGVQTEPPVTWISQGIVQMPPIDQGVTPSELTWMLYAGDFFDSRLVWLDKESRVLSNFRQPERQSMMIGIDQDSVAYICSNNFTIQVKCKALEMGSEVPVWEFELGDGVLVIGGALVEDRLYITTDAGILYALGKPEVEGTQVSQANIANPVIATVTTTPETATVTVTLSPTLTPTTAPAHTEPAIAATPNVQGEGSVLFLPTIFR